MKDKKRVFVLGAAAVGLGIILTGLVQAADDFSDGISEYSDDSIASEDSIGSKKDTNINFIVVDAIGKAKSKKSKDAADDDRITNFDDGSLEDNVNSVVIEAGSEVEQVYNIIIEK